MIKSMTGFGRSEVVSGARKIVVEIKAVNHRFCEINVKTPKKLSFFETTIRAYLKKYIERGKVDVFITYEDLTETNVSVKYNKELAEEYVGYMNQMAADFNLTNDISPSIICRLPEVFILEEQTVDEDELWSLIQGALDEAADKFVKSRMVEGENLDNMTAAVDYIEEVSPELITAYRQKLIDKISELIDSSAIDENRIATEVVIYADKICVDEETVRLKSHIDSTRKILEAGGSVGRKLDFIAQEMNREANTILSKANDLEVSNLAIELKTEIEKIREQIQNIE